MMVVFNKSVFRPSLYNRNPSHFSPKINEYDYFWLYKKKLVLIHASACKVNDEESGRMMKLYTQTMHFKAIVPTPFYVLSNKKEGRQKMTCPRAGERGQPPGVSLIPPPSTDQFIPMILRDMCWIITAPWTKLKVVRERQTQREREGRKKMPVHNLESALVMYGGFG